MIIIQIGLSNCVWKEVYERNLINWIAQKDTISFFGDRLGQAKIIL